MRRKKATSSFQNLTWKVDTLNAKCYRPVPGFGTFMVLLAPILSSPVVFYSRCGPKVHSGTVRWMPKTIKASSNSSRSYLYWRIWCSPAALHLHQITPSSNWHVLEMPQTSRSDALAILSLSIRQQGKDIRRWPLPKTVSSPSAKAAWHWTIQP